MTPPISKKTEQAAQQAVIASSTYTLYSDFGINKNVRLIIQLPCYNEENSGQYHHYIFHQLKDKLHLDGQSTWDSLGRIDFGFNHNTPEQVIAALSDKLHVDRNKVKRIDKHTDAVPSSTPECDIPIASNLKKPDGYTKA